MKAQASIERAEQAAPAGRDRLVDLVHLARQTLGDQGLERELLRLFLVQSDSVLRRIDAAEDADQRRAAAHTIKGSARGIGAWGLADAAERLEEAAENDAARAIEALRVEVEAVNGFIRHLVEARPA